MKSHRLLIFLVSCFLPLVSFAAAWQTQLVTKKNINQQATYRLLKFKETSTHQVVTVNTVQFNTTHYEAKIIDQKPLFHFFSFQRVYTTTKNNDAFVGVNGSFFTPKNKPLGLMILNGKQISPLNQRSSLLSGLLLINQQGKISLAKRGADYQQAVFALQGGPFLIRPGGHFKLNPTDKYKRRTVVAISKQNQLLVVSASPVSLYDLGYLLKHFPKSFGVHSIDTALNLDGGSSTAMTVLFPHNHPLIIPEVFPVRNALLFKLK